MIRLSGYAYGTPNGVSEAPPLGGTQSPAEGNRSEFGEEFGEGSLDRSTERGSAELTVEA